LPGHAAVVHAAPAVGDAHGCARRRPQREKSMTAFLFVEECRAVLDTRGKKEKVRWIRDCFSGSWTNTLMRACA
jgi:hypothetical protein